MTAVQQLIKIIKQKRKESEISNTLLKFVQFKAEMLLKIEKQQQDEFAIGFARWCMDNNQQVILNDGKYLLEIYKKEKGL